MAAIQVSVIAIEDIVRDRLERSVASLPPPASPPPHKRLLWGY